MSDRELLELAAKAAGDFTTAKYYRVADDLPVVFMLNDKPWNPLKDDGDALRLAVKLRMDVCIGTPFDIEPGIHAIVFVADDSSETVDVEVPIGNDPYAATRRAIVRAAAEIGKATGEQA